MTKARVAHLATRKMFPDILFSMAVWGLVSVVGCTGLHYGVQAACGEIDLLTRAVPITRLIKRGGAAPPKLRAVLMEIPEVKAFGRAHGLRATASYQSYAELDREAAVWVVTAAKPLAFSPKTWNVPILGSFPYLGWFERKDADAFATSLRLQGWDAYVRGAGAYSTLGFFKDPVVSTMIPHGDQALGELVNAVLHESTHATLHLRGQAVFNESLASFVADTLTPTYLAERHGRQSVAYRAYEVVEARQGQRVAALLSAYAVLDAVYRSTSDETTKLAKKRSVYEALQRRLGLDEPPNNAALTGLWTYHAGIDAFAELYNRCGRDWLQFWRAAKSLSPKDFVSEQQDDLEPVLSALGRRACARS